MTLLKDNSAYQLTIHYNNYDAFFGVGSFISHYKTLTSGVPGCDIDPYTILRNLINYYGHDTITEFLTMIGHTI